MGGITTDTIIKNGADIVVNLIFFILIRMELNKHSGEQ